MNMDGVIIDSTHVNLRIIVLLSRKNKDNFCSSNVRFIQEATLDYLQTLEQWTENYVAVRQRERTNEHHPKPRRRKWLTRHYARVIVGKRRNIPHLLHLPHPAWVWRVREVRAKKDI